jgi:hypothetical protein
MKTFQRLISMMALLALSACGGGGGNAGDSVFGGGTGGGTGGGGTGGTLVADVDVQLSASTIPNTGTSTVTATITALDANRNAISGTALTVAANSGAVLTIAGTAGSVTDATGRIVATVGIGSDHTNRDITVSATAGSVTRSAILRVVNSAIGNTPTSIEVIAASTTVGTGGDAVLISAFVKDANNNTLPSAALSFSTNTGTLSNVSTRTDASGAASATFSSGASKSNRIALLTVASGTISAQLTLPVTGTRLTLSGPSSLILGSSATFDILVTDSKGNVVPGVTVTGSSSLNNPLASPAGGSTNSSGQVRFAYTATNPGTDSVVFSGAGASVSPIPALAVSGEDFAFVSPAPSATVAVNTAQSVQVRLRSGGVPQVNKVINFAATGGTLSSASATTDAFGIASVDITSASAGPVTVQASVPASTTSTTLPLTIVATVPSKLVLQISPTALAPNLGTASANQAQVVAKVTDASGNPVQGQTVNFTRLVDPSGGNLLQASAVTNASGQASVAYRSGAESTANNGVELQAMVSSAPTVSGKAKLTVNQTALFIALGTGNVISNLDPQTYRKDWVVYVTDSNGIPVNGVTMTIKAIPTSYLTGKLAWNGVVWAYSGDIYTCRNEDENRNGVLDAGEDDNRDDVLWPGNVIAVTPGNVQTVDGRATISLVYAESYAPWVELELTASATVSGTESKTNVTFIVSGASEDFTKEEIPPAGVVSPFGLVPKPLTVTGACRLLP